MNENEIVTIIIISAISVHRELSPGLFETVFKVALAHEIIRRGHYVQNQKPVAISCILKSSLCVPAPLRENNSEKFRKMNAGFDLIIILLQLQRNVASEKSILLPAEARRRRV